MNSFGSLPSYWKPEGFNEPNRSAVNDLPFRQRIKAATHQTHQQLDDLIAGLKPFRSPSGYAFFLKNMLLIHQRGAASLRWAEEAAALPPRRKCLETLLLEDLESAAATVNEQHESVAPESVAAKWGEAYVLAGSAVGGSYMYKSAQHVLPADQSTAYLQQLSNDAKERWPMFVQSLTTAGDSFDENEAQAAIAAANCLFEYAFTLFSQTADSE